MCSPPTRLRPPSSPFHFFLSLPPWLPSYVSVSPKRLALAQAKELGSEATRVEVEEAALGVAMVEAQRPLFAIRLLMKGTPFMISW